MSHSQPKALRTLFLTEMWERFGFYVVQGLLVLYMTNHLNFSDAKSYAILGEYSALVYISPLIGGFFADRVLGFRYAILIGAIFLLLGYAVIATTSDHLLFWGLAAVILGNGFLKPNISSYLGEFYQTDDPRRDAGFTIFYMGINIGVMLSTASSGFIQQTFGWRAAFACAAVGMLIGIFAFISGFKRFGKLGLPLQKNRIYPTYLRIFTHKPVLLLTFVLITISAYLMLRVTSIGHILLIFIGISMLVWLFIRAFRYDAVSRNKLIALIVLIVISIVFWGLFFQMFSAVSLFTERNVNRLIFGIQIPPVAFISLESIAVLALGSPLAMLWRYLHSNHRSPSVGYKFSLAMLCSAISMGILVLAIHLPNAHQQIYPAWLILFFFMVTLGEMLLSPIGLSMVTELAPPQLVGLMMGVWFMALGYGGLLSGSLAQLADIPKSVTDIHITNHIYQHAFTIYGLIALAAAIVTLAIAPWIKKLITETHYQARG